MVEECMKGRVYDKENIFAKIIRKEARAELVYEDSQVLVFKDKNPVADLHLLVVPKGEYECFHDFIDRATTMEIAHFFRTIQRAARVQGLHIKGYKLVTNNGVGVGQSVPHFHFHLLAGRGVHNQVM
jgi:diadenosine tetraphosphate (Ap4A) HIT family hydrolase